MHHYGMPSMPHVIYPKNMILLVDPLGVMSSREYLILPYLNREDRDVLSPDHQQAPLPPKPTHPPSTMTQMIPIVTTLAIRIV